MLNRIISWSIDHRVIVFVAVGVLAILGIRALVHLPIDAFPDTTPVQVQVNTTAPALSPAEIEAQVTVAVESALGGLPGLEEMRSLSRFGLSQVVLVFADGTDVYFARQRVSEALQGLELPETIDPPRMGPVATGLGEIYHYLVTSATRSLRELTTIHDWDVKPRLRAVPGVAEVNTWGGEERQFHVIVDPVRLVKFDLTLDDLVEALGRNNRSVGGGNIVTAGESHLVRGASLPRTTAEIANIFVASEDGTPVRVRDVARVEEGHALRHGAVTAEGKGEVVLGLGFMLMGENSHEVTRRLRIRMDEIRKTLPDDVEVTPVYERTELVEQVIHTATENLLEGAVLVIAVLFALLGNIRAGLVVAAAIPLSMLFAVDSMVRFGIAGSLMSLGAIDFGLVVDSSVITVENSMRRLAEAGGARPRRDVVREASLEVRRATLFGELIIMVVYLPILLLEGVEGRLFRPMALTVVFALLGSLILSITLMPALASTVLPARPRHGENRVVAALRRRYRPVVRFAMRNRRRVLAGAVGVVVAASALAFRLGSEFIPRLSESSIVINTVRLASVSLDESIRYGTAIESFLLKEFPDEVKHIWSRTGTAEIATDPMGIEVTDVFMTLHPRDRWKRAGSQDELVEALRAEVSQLPGMRAVFTQPIEMRVNEMEAGIRADLGVKIFGDDLDVLRAKAAEVQAVLEGIPGATDLYTEQLTGQPVLDIEVDPDAAARHGIAAEEVLEWVETVGGLKAGEVRDGQRRYDLVVRLDDRYRNDPHTLGDLIVPSETGARVPLAGLARVRETEGPTTITREWGKRRIVVQSNVEGRDTGSFVTEARRRIERDVEFPEGYHVEFGGQFEHLARARSRLAVIIPLALGLVLLLLRASTGSMRDALLIMTGAPLAAAGGVVALWSRGMPFTISAGVGFVAVCGVAMLNGLVLVSTIRQLREGGAGLDDAIEEAALVRLRPILMTALVASLGFLPMAVNSGIGAEVQRPLATVVLAGVISANLLNLVVLPALYRAAGGRGRGAAGS